MALKGINVIEFASPVTASSCGMILADFGASVIIIDRVRTEESHELGDCLSNGKLSIAVNIKSPEGETVIKKLCQKSDVLIEPFRAGVMESCGLGPEVLQTLNPQLIYARISGYGRNVQYSKKAGHDLNYLALSGLLSLFGRVNQKPTPPINFACALAGGSFVSALGIILALLERKSSGMGQVVDTNMIAGAAYVGSWLFRSQKLSYVWGLDRGKNLLDGGSPFYEIYETKDGKYVAVAAIEPKFYEQLLKGLGLTVEELPQFGDFTKNFAVFERKFKEKMLDEWMEIFENLDACVSPVLDPTNVMNHPYNQQENIFILDEEGCVVPKPAPLLCRTPGISNSSKPPRQIGKHTKLLLESLNYSQQEILDLESSGVIQCFATSKL